MTLSACKRAFLLSAIAVAAAAPVNAQQPAAPAPAIKIGIVSFLSGPAAGPFGVPGRNAAEIVIEAINAGSIPAHRPGSSTSAWPSRVTTARASNVVAASTSAG